MEKYRVYFYGGVSSHGNYGVDYMISHVNPHTEFNPVCGYEEEVTDEIYVEIPSDTDGCENFRALKLLFLEEAKNHGLTESDFEFEIKE